MFLSKQNQQQMTNEKHQNVKLYRFGCKINGVSKYLSPKVLISFGRVGRKRTGYSATEYRHTGYRISTHRLQNLDTNYNTNYNTKA